MTILEQYDIISTYDPAQIQEAVSERGSAALNDGLGAIELLEILEQLNDTQDRSERYREALVLVLNSTSISNAHEIARNALHRA